MISDVVRMALLKAGMQQNELAKIWGISSRQAMNNKFARGSWSANDLANVAEITGGKLVIVYPDGQEFLVKPEAPPAPKGKALGEATPEE